MSPHALVRSLIDTEIEMSERLARDAVRAIYLCMLHQHACWQAVDGDGSRCEVGPSHVHHRAAGGRVAAAAEQALPIRPRLHCSTVE